MTREQQRAYEERTKHEREEYRAMVKRVEEENQRIRKEKIKIGNRLRKQKSRMRQKAKKKSVEKLKCRGKASEVSKSLSVDRRVLNVLRINSFFVVSAGKF